LADTHSHHQGVHAKVIFSAPPDVGYMYQLKHVGIIPIVKLIRCTISQIYFILEQRSTCFGRSLRPSSGV